MTKIMLVEDDKSLREIYSIRLVAEGYDIVSAGDGEEALALAVQEKPELIVSDVMMPKISGFDMLDILRSTPETSQIKVIMMTALSSDDQRMRGENLGADRYLVKSQVGIEDVINTVHEVLGDRPSANAGANLDVAAAVPQPTSPNIAGPAPAPAAPAATPAPAPAPAAPTTPQPIIPVQPTAPAAPVAPVAPQPVIPQAPVTPQPIAPQPIAPAPAPAAPQPAEDRGGERVIEPLNDPTSKESRDEMSRKMDELLGNVPTEQSRPTQVADAPAAAPDTPEAIQPGYAQNLANDLSQEMQIPAAPGTNEANMTAELANDSLTQQAEAMNAAPGTLDVNQNA